MSMDILVLGAGNVVRTDNGFPAFLNETDSGMMLLEHIVERLRIIPSARLYFAFLAEDARRYHLDSVAQRLSDDAQIVRVPSHTKGAACTALLAVDHIEPEHELLLVSANEIIDADLARITETFRARGWDAATLTFRSLHPRYSYVALDNDGLVAQASQCNPISNHATTGLFWFRKARDFIDAAKNAIRKDASHDGNYYVAPLFNELLLMGKKVGHMPIDPKAYKPLKSAKQMASFETAHHLHAVAA